MTVRKKRVGNYARGERHGKAVLTQEQVNRIRERYGNGYVSMEDLRIEYEVSKGTIWNAIHGKTYAEG